MSDTMCSKVYTIQPTCYLIWRESTLPYFDGALPPLHLLRIVETAPRRIACMSTQDAQNFDTSDKSFEEKLQARDSSLMRFISQECWNLKDSLRFESWKGRL